jgi:hypothetical protein
LYVEWEKDIQSIMTWLNLGHINTMLKRADRLRLYYNIFLHFDGSMLTYLVVQEEEEVEEGLK